ncbi:MAG: RHS repeat protein [Gammaproteobacteria bacterium]|nr:RHS repeat protein [Gammaproteobacteria bacterium]
MAKMPSGSVKPNHYGSAGSHANTTGMITPQATMGDATVVPPKPQPETQSWWGRWGDTIHIALDVVGMIPVIGEVADGANALLYLAEGDHVNAALSAAAMLPIGGQAATAAKAAKRGAEAAVATGKAAKTTAEAGVKAGREAGEAVAQAAGKKGTNGGTVSGKGKDAKGNGQADKSKPNCDLTKPTGSKPVNAVQGSKVLAGSEDLDFYLPSPLPFVWQRTYVSSNALSGMLGQGWMTPLCVQLESLDDETVYTDTEGRRFSFPVLAVGEEFYSRFEQLLLRRNLRHEYELIDAAGLHYVFARPFDRVEHSFALNRRQYTPQATQRVGSPEDGRLLYLNGFFDRSHNCWAIRRTDDGLATEVIGSSAIGLKLDYLHLEGIGPRLAGVKRFWGDPAQPEQLLPLVEYRYSPAGDLIEVLDDNAQSCRRFVWRNHMMVEHSQPGGVVARYEWNLHQPSGKVLRSYLSTGEEWTFAYQQNRTQVTNQEGHVQWFEFDDEQELTGLIDPLGGVRRFDLDYFGHVRRDLQPGGVSTQYDYDERGQITRVTHADGHSLQLSWCSRWHELLSITDELGRVTRYAYDEQGRLTKITHADGNQTRLERNAQGLVTRMVDALGKTRTYEYNAQGLLTQQTDCSGHATQWHHDHWGNITQMKDAQGQITRFDYQRINRASRLTQVQWPDGSRERFAYDNLGRLVGHQDALERVTRYQLDASGLPLEQENALGDRVRYQYDSQGRLIELQNENRARYHFSWDALGRLVAEQGFDGRRQHYRYDAAGYLVEALDGVGSEERSANTPETHTQPIRTRFQRDVLGRLLGKYSIKSQPGQRPLIQRDRYQYDAAGQLITARNAHARVVLHHDAMGNLLEEQLYQRGRGLSQLRHEYDELGNRLRTHLPDGRQLDTLRYGSGHVFAMELDGASLCDMERDSLHREISRSQGALRSRYQWDAMGRLLASRTERQQQSLVGEPSSQGQQIARSYQYDAAGQLTAISDTRKGLTRYGYDELGRLLSAAHPFAVNEVFAFDPAHNLISQQQAEHNQKKRQTGNRWSEEEWQAYVKANAHRADFDPWLTPEQGENDPRFWGEARPNRLSTWQDHRYQYDDFGNCTEKISGSANNSTQQSYEWDAEHRLSKVWIERTHNGKTTREGWGYDYDPFGRRLAKYPLDAEANKARDTDEKAKALNQSRPWKSPQATYYGWDGHQLISEQTGNQYQLYIYEPDSFVPLALVSSEINAKNQPTDELVEALKDSPLQWQQLQHQYPEHWVQVLNQQQKYRQKAGVV